VTAQEAVPAWFAALLPRRIKGSANRIQPPRKKAAASSKSSTPAKQSRRSKLAKENDITAEEEAEIKEAWNLFRQDGVKNFEDEKDGVIRTGDVRHAMK